LAVAHSAWLTFHSVPRGPPVSVARPSRAVAIKRDMAMRVGIFNMSDTDESLSLRKIKIS
jgi:hypothetical protein